MIQKKHRLLLGAHMSIADGFEYSIERGTSIHCATIQIFTKSNRQWQAKQITQEQIDAFKKAARNSNISPIVVHASYLINMGSADATLHKKSVAAFKEELLRCESLEIPYFIFHPGSHVGFTEKDCLNKITDSLNEILAQVPDKTTVLLENMAGQGSTVCYRFEQIAYILEKSSFKKRIGVCFDTCHAFTAGYDFRTPQTYEYMWKEFDEIIGLEYLKVIHLNDSKKDLGSRVDRHEDIGKGKLGLETFRLIMNDERLFDIPKILETPDSTLDAYAKNMDILKKLISSKNKEILNIES